LRGKGSARQDEQGRLGIQDIINGKVPCRYLKRPDSRSFGRPDPPNVHIYIDRAVINPKLHRLAGNKVKRPGWVVLGFEGWKENRWEVVI
jgi:hypothetical protein